MATFAETQGNRTVGVGFDMQVQFERSLVGAARVANCGVSERRIAGNRRVGPFGQGLETIVSHEFGRKFAFAWDLKEGGLLDSYTRGSLAGDQDRRRRYRQLLANPIAAPDEIESEARLEISRAAGAVVEKELSLAPDESLDRVVRQTD